MKAKYARLIRIGIMSRCIPYKINKEPDPVFGRHFSSLDHRRLRELQYDWEINKHQPLAQRARERTRPWTSKRIV